jgi:hypothetical protein
MESVDELRGKMGRLENEFSTRLVLEPTGSGARSWAEPKFNVAEKLKWEGQVAVKKMLSCARQKIASLAAVLAEWSRVARGAPFMPMILARPLLISLLRLPKSNM